MFSVLVIAGVVGLLTRLAWLSAGKWALLLPVLVVAGYSQAVRSMQADNADFCMRAVRETQLVGADGRRQIQGHVIRVTDPYCMRDLCRTALERLGNIIILQKTSPDIIRQRPEASYDMSWSGYSAMWLMIQRPFSASECKSLTCVSLYAHATQSPCPRVTVAGDGQSYSLRYQVSESDYATTFASYRRISGQIITRDDRVVAANVAYVPSFNGWAQIIFGEFTQHPGCAGFDGLSGIS